MGTWAEDAFGNDVACDWVYALEQQDDLSGVERAIEMVLGTVQNSLDANLACEALAACEVVARLEGHVGFENTYTKGVDAWVAAHPLPPPKDLIQRAIAAVDRIVRDPSELKELWDGDTRWISAVKELRSRLLAGPALPALDRRK